MKTLIIIAAFALTLVSCDKREPELDSKLSQLEKQATEAVERQRLLEAELAEQKILAERDAIERERTMIEQERMALDELRNAENAAALAELERRQAELMERERKISENQEELDRRQQLLTGLESELSERELDLAGREPLDALPPVQKNYVSGPTGDFSNFYEPLAAYGSWFQTSDYGYVYQPTIVRDTTWRPYTRGRWAFTDHGWTWVSNEPFGWACYHYGRWALLRNIGWVWIPGNQWAPAWVSWRESPGHIGWAPLPPETLAWHSDRWDSGIDVRFGIDSNWFSFVSYRNFGSDIYSHCLPYTQNLVIYQSTTTVTHYVFRDRIVYCGGPRYRNVCDRIGRRFPIHRLRHDYSPDFGRGGRRLHSQFSGNELLVVAPRMDAEWNPALRPSRVSRDLGQVFVNRSNELTEDVRKQYRDRRQQDEEKATRWVANTGGREAFENDRKSRIEKNREVVLKNESPRRAERESNLGKNRNPDRPQPPVVTDASDGSDDRKKRPNVRDSKRPDPGDPTTPNPELPVVPSTGEPAKPTITDLNKTRDERLKNNTGNLPPGVTPTPPVTDNRLKENRLNGPSTGAPRNQANDNRNDDKRTETEKQAAEDLRRQQEAAREERQRLDRDLKLQQEQQADLLRRQQQEAKKAQEKQAELELEQRQQKEKQEKLNQQSEQEKRFREQKEQGDNLRQLQEKQELERKEQHERLRAQQEQLKQAREQQDKLREQQAQQEQARKQQEETQGRLKEQQERLRQQQEEATRRAQEQQEKMRAQQEQQERLRAQQDQQERLRQQQEESQRRAQEQQRAQQEQLERARQQQEEALRRAQEQQERMRAQQEQQERARQQQEEAQRRAQEEAQRRMEEQQRAQQEQQERARQQQEETQRRMQERQR